jgi:hypothetical protein
MKLTLRKSAMKRLQVPARTEFLRALQAAGLVPRSLIGATIAPAERRALEGFGVRAGRTRRRDGWMDEAPLQTGQWSRTQRPGGIAPQQPGPGGLEGGASLQFEGSVAMKRYVIAIAALGFVLGANAAFADNNWAFDDAYWKAPETVGAVKAPEVGAPTTGERSPYYLVDDFNP